MPGEGVQLQVIAHQRVQPVEAAAHVARAQAQIHPHAGRQVHHARNASITIRNVAPSTPERMRNCSPLANTISTSALIAGFSLLDPCSTSAKRTGAALSRSRLRQS